MLRYFLLFLFLFPVGIFAQSKESLSYKEVVAIALKNNFDILLARNGVEATELQNTWGNAGFLPKIDINANGNLASNNTNQQFANGLEVKQNSVQSNTINAGAFLNWTIFDGMKMFATKERLSLLAQQSKVDLKIQIENTIEEVTLAYYQLVKQDQLIKGILAAMEVSEERIKIAEKKKLLGSGSNVELLQAKMDLNAQRSNLIVQNSFLKEQKTFLLELIKADPNITFSVDTNFVFESLNSLESVKKQVLESNNNIQKLQNATLIAAQLLKETRALRYPTIGLSSNYLFGRTQNEVGFALFNQNLGLNNGLTFSWNIFNGGRTNQQMKIAKLQQQNANLLLDKGLRSAQSVTLSAYHRWLGDQEVLTIEEENIQLARQSLQISTERLKLGLGNYLETKESQNSFEAAITRLVNARYNLKQSETLLLKLCGNLVR